MATALPQNSNGPWIVTSTWALTAVGSFFVLLRFYCRIFRGHTFPADDWILLIAWILLLSQTILSVYSVRLGSGEHIWNIDPALSEALLMLQDITTAPSVLAVAFSKASAGVSLLRLLPFRWQRVLTIFIITSIGMLMSAIIVLTCIQCVPIQKHWNFQLPGTCWDPDIVAKFAIGAAIWSGVMDIILAILPLPVILGLQMNKREKLGVAIALSFMAFAGASSFIKASTLINLSSTDPTYDIAPVIVFGTAEIAVTIIAACIPVLRVLVRDVAHAGTLRYGNTLRSHSHGGGSHSHSNHSINTQGSAQRTITANTGPGGPKARLMKSRLSSQANGPLEGMLEKTTMIEYSDAKRHSNWVLDPVNLSPRTLFDEQLSKTMSLDPRRTSV
ncbi:uncharacterized protein PG986_011568 [Apiospora aurea]|uniref:Rhodopsin domain-containing protein n=1 Tax=Apiospora aurea TaxID=335848 RepID=A0ABR1PXT5_9PEZI